MDSDEETGTESGSDSESGSESCSESCSGSELDAESQKELHRRNNSNLPKEWKSSEKGRRVVANKESSKDKKPINVENKQDKTRDISQPRKPSQAQTKKNYIAKSSSDSETSNDDDNGTAGEDNMENSSTSVSTNVGDKAKSKKSGQEENKDSEDDGSSESKSESLEKSDEDNEESENEESDNQRSDMSCSRKPEKAPKDKSDTSLNNSSDEKEEDKEESENGTESTKSSTLSVKKKYSSKQVEEENTEEQESLKSNPDEISEEIDKDDFDQEYTSAGSAFEEGNNKRNRKSINKRKKIHKNSSSSSSISDTQEIKSEQENEGTDSDPSEKDDSSKQLYRSSNSSDEDDVKSCRESDESRMGKSVKKRDKDKGHPEMIDDVILSGNEDENMTIEERKCEKGEETSELESSASADDNEETSDQDIVNKDNTEDHISSSYSQSDTVSEKSRSSAYNIKVPEEKAKRTMRLINKSDKSILSNYDSALKTKDPKYGSRNGADFKGIITEHCLPENDRRLLKVMSSGPSSVPETENSIALESMTGTKPKCNSAPVLRGTHSPKAEMVSSSSESELSDESYLLQNFTLSSDSESSNTETQSGSEGSSKDKKKEDTTKTYPPPVEKPWKYKHHSHPVMEHVQMYALLPGTVFFTLDGKLNPTFLLRVFSYYWETFSEFCIFFFILLPLVSKITF